MQCWAAGAKLPLITTHVGGIPEIFGPQKDLLLPAGDGDAVCRAMREALQDPARHVSQAETLHQRVASQFSAARMVENVCGFYEDVLISRQAVEVQRQSAA